jgi:hypothetical protein
MGFHPQQRIKNPVDFSDKQHWSQMGSGYEAAGKQHYPQIAVIR